MSFTGKGADGRFPSEIVKGDAVGQEIADADLYMIDLKDAGQSGRYEYRRLDINSDESESWHSWSSNSRWIAFSSKRGGEKPWQMERE